MAVLNKDDYMSRLQTIIGDDTSDEALAFIGDMTDTFNDLESRSTGSSDEEWQNKYNELDKSWREKYKARFFATDETPGSGSGPEPEPEPAEEKTYADLFEERED